MELERDAMLGRVEELAELVARARQREVGALVSIVGEPWMGKTRLIEEFGSVVERDGVDVLVARAFRSEQSLPYGVVTQLLTPLVSLSEQVGSAPDWALAELARLNPRLTPGLPPPSDTFGELRLFEAFRALVEHVGVARRIGFGS